MRHAQYVYRSRHGIYYFRAVFPCHLRRALPHLPKELKASTNCSNRVSAGPLLRRFYARWTDLVATLEAAVELPRLSRWEVIDTLTSRTVRTTPDDTPETLAELRHYLREHPFRPAAAPGTWQGAATLAASDSTPRGVIEPGAVEQPAETERPQDNRRDAWLSAAIDKFHQSRIETGAWREPTWTNTYAPALRLFRELIAKMQRVPEGSNLAIWDIRMSDITVDGIEACGKSLKAYPHVQGKRPSHLDAKAILNAGGESQSPQNADKKLGNISVFLNWAVDNDYAGQELPNAIARLRMVKESDTNGYLPFSMAELRAIFHAPGYADDAFSEAWQHWCPKIALFTGARLHEIAGLTVDRFVEVEGIECIHFPSGKTKSAWRLVPIADQLIADGLLDYVACRKRAGKKELWDGLVWEEKSGYGRYVSEWFRQHSRDCGVSAKHRKVFHSFRSTLPQALEAQQLDGLVIDRLLGHAVKTTRSKHYNRRPDGLPPNTPVKLIRQKLDAINFEVTWTKSKKWGGASDA